MEHRRLTSIVVGVDGSDGSRRAAIFARHLADSFDARLTMVLAVEPLPERALAGLGLPPDQVRARQMAAGQAILDELCQELRLNADDTVLVIGSPAEVLCAEADEREADIIVVGARGHGPHRLNAGSVGVRLLNMANRTVTVVR